MVGGHNLRNLKGRGIRNLRTAALDAQVYERHTNTCCTSRPQRDTAGNRRTSVRATYQHTLYF